MAYDHRRDLQAGDRALPDGVPASNRESAETRASFSSSGFEAPDMATPRFARERTAAQTVAQAERRDGGQGPEKGSGVRAAATLQPSRTLDAAQGVDGAPLRGSDRASRRGWFSPGQTILFAAILILLGALGVSVLLGGAGGATPLCADQPHWNQYNCRAY